VARGFASSDGSCFGLTEAGTAACDAAGLPSVTTPEMPHGRSDERPADRREAQDYAPKEFRCGGDDWLGSSEGGESPLRG
jgi:hypothetical protein